MAEEVVLMKETKPLPTLLSVVESMAISDTLLLPNQKYWKPLPN